MSMQVQALPNACCVLSPSLQKINILVKDSIKVLSNYVKYIKSLLHCDIIIDTIE